MAETFQKTEEPRARHGGREREQEVKWDKRGRRWSQRADKAPGGGMKAGGEEELEQRDERRRRQGAKSPEGQRQENKGTGD